MSKLIEILDRHNINGWDKEGGTDKATIHTYTDDYERLLSPYIGKEPSLLEIGVWHGGSSLLWQEYLQNALISGVDVSFLIDENVSKQLSHHYLFYRRNAYCCVGVDEADLERLLSTVFYLD